MALNKRPTFTHRPMLSCVQILPADTDDLKVLVTAGETGEKLVGAFATGEVTANRDLALYVTRSAVDYLIATIAVPLNSGRTNALPPVDLFTTELRALLPKDADQQPYLFLNFGDVLKVGALSTVTADESISAFAVHASFDDEV